jgi:hypothetical protein
LEILFPIKFSSVRINLKKYTLKEMMVAKISLNLLKIAGTGICKEKTFFTRMFVLGLEVRGYCYFSVALY